MPPSPAGRKIQRPSASILLFAQLDSCRAALGFPRRRRSRLAVPALAAAGPRRRRPGPLRRRPGPLRRRYPSCRSPACSSAARLPAGPLQPPRQRGPAAARPSAPAAHGASAPKLQPHPVLHSSTGINIVNWRGLELLQHPQESNKQDMDSVPLTAEAIAFTEKKMDMTLEDIIKMSKKKIPAGKKAPRQQVKKRPFQNGNSNQGKAKVQRFHESRSSIRQGVLAQRRSNLDANQFQITKQAANKAATMPVRGRADRWNKPSGPSTSAQRRTVSEALQNSKGKEMQNEPPRTMDALFAQMKQQRMRIMPPQQSNATHGHQVNQQRRGQQQRRRGRGGYGVRSGGGNR